MVISVDVDIALREVPQAQELVRFLNLVRRTMPQGHQLLNVAAITNLDRDEWENSYQFKRFLDIFGMSMRDVYFTDGRSKLNLIVELGVDIHIDYDMSAVDEINRELPGRAWLINFSRERAGKYIKKNGNF